jgi:hypothetical protein
LFFIVSFPGWVNEKMTNARTAVPNASPIKAAGVLTGSLFEPSEDISNAEMRDVRS